MAARNSQRACGINGAEIEIVGRRRIGIDALYSRGGSCRRHAANARSGSEHRGVVSKPLLSDRSRVIIKHPARAGM